MDNSVIFCSPWCYAVCCCSAGMPACGISTRNPIAPVTRRAAADRRADRTGGRTPGRRQPRVSADIGRSAWSRQISILALNRLRTAFRSMRPKLADRSIRSARGSTISFSKPTRRRWIKTAARCGYSPRKARRSQHFAQFGWVGNGEWLADDAPSGKAMAARSTPELRSLCAGTMARGQRFQIELSIDDQYMITARQTVANTAWPDRWWSRHFALVNRTSLHRQRQHVECAFRPDRQCSAMRSTSALITMMLAEESGRRRMAKGRQLDRLYRYLLDVRAHPR